MIDRATDMAICSSRLLAASDKGTEPPIWGLMPFLCPKHGVLIWVNDVWEAQCCLFPRGHLLTFCSYVMTVKGVTFASTPLNTSLILITWFFIAPVPCSDAPSAPLNLLGQEMAPRSLTVTLLARYIASCNHLDITIAPFQMESSSGSLTAPLWPQHCYQIDASCLIPLLASIQMQVTACKKKSQPLTNLVWCSGGSRFLAGCSSPCLLSVSPLSLEQLVPACPAECEAAKYKVKFCQIPSTGHLCLSIGHQSNGHGC